MKLRNKIAACAAFTAASFGGWTYSTSRQIECFNGVKNNYGVDSINDMSNKVVSDSGCFSIYNTIGLLAFSGGVVGTAAVVIVDRRRRKDIPYRNNRERLPVIRPAKCLGATCIYFSGQDCESRLELLEATGKSGGVDIGPFVKDSSYALYGQVCTGGEENVVIGRHAESPNGTASSMELIGRMGRLDDQDIVLTPRN